MGDLVGRQRATGQSADIAAILACGIAGLTAVLLGRFTVLPPVLVALGAGMALRSFHRLSARGVSFCSSTLLKLGIAFIGARLSIADFTIVGPAAIIAGIGSVVLGLTFGTMIAVGIGLHRSRAILCAGAVAICGASAALAISAVLPARERSDQETCYTIAAVTLLSTVAMLLYPVLAHLLHFNDAQAGVFLGASIHDLTQVIGAGALISGQAMEVATVTKLMRVACLAPAVILIGAYFQSTSKEAPPLVPWFIVGFLVLALVTNLGLLPPDRLKLFSSLGTFCLVTATFALGYKTTIADLLVAGWRPFGAIAGQTLFLMIPSAIAAWVLL